MVDEIGNALSIRYKQNTDGSNVGPQNPSDKLNSVFGKTGAKAGLASDQEDSYSTALEPTMKAGGLVFGIIDAIKKKNGPAVVIALDLDSKTKTLCDNYYGKMLTCIHEMNSSSVAKLSPEDKKKKIEDLNDKIRLLQKEADAKIDVLGVLAAKLPELDAMMKEMESKGIPTDKISKFFSDMINKVNVSVSNVSDDAKDQKADNKNSNSASGVDNNMGASTQNSVKDEKNIDNKIKDSILGSGADTELDKQKKDIETKLNELKQKISDGASSASNDTQQKSKTPQFGQLAQASQASESADPTQTAQTAQTSQAETTSPESNGKNQTEIKVLTMELEIIESLKGLLGKK